MSRENPFAGIEFPSALNLETDPTKLNPYEGIVKSFGGIIKDYQTKEENNKLANFQKALGNFQLKGDTTGINELVNYSDSFLDPTNQLKARELATKVHDATTLVGLTKAVQEAEQTGDPTKIPALESIKFFNPEVQQNALKVLNEGISKSVIGNIQLKLQEAQAAQNPEQMKAVIDSIPSLPISPDKKAELISKTSDIYESLQASTLGKTALGNYFSGLTESPENIPIYQNILTSTPEFSKVIQLKDGKVLPVNIPETEINALVQAQYPNLKKGSSEFNTAFSEIGNRVQTERSALVDKFYQQAAGLGAKPTQVNLDQAIRNLRATGVSRNLSPKSIEDSVRVFTTLAQAQSELGPQATGRLNQEYKRIDDDVNFRIAELTELKDLTKSLGVKDSKTLEVLKSENKELLDAITGISTDWTIGFTQDNRADLEDAIAEKVRPRNFTDASGKSRPATDREIAIAINAQKEAQGFSLLGDAKPTINADAIDTYVSNIVANSNVYDALQNNEKIRGEIKNYHEQVRKIKADAGTEKLKFQQRLLAESGNPTSFSNTQLEKAARLLTSNPQNTAPQSTQGTTNVSQTLANAIAKNNPNAFNIVKSVVFTESSDNPNAINTKSGATGLGQFLPSTAKKPGLNTTNVFDTADSLGISYKDKSNAEVTRLLKDPRVSAPMTVQYLSGLAKKFGKEELSDNMSDDALLRALIGYNYNHSVANKPVIKFSSLPKETQEYATKIFNKLDRKVPTQVSRYDDRTNKFVEKLKG